MCENCDKLSDFRQLRRATWVVDDPYPNRRYMNKDPEFWKAVLQSLKDFLRRK